MDRVELEIGGKKRSLLLTSPSRFELASVQKSEKSKRLCLVPVRHFPLIPGRLGR